MPNRRQFVAATATVALAGCAGGSGSGGGDGSSTDGSDSTSNDADGTDTAMLSGSTDENPTAQSTLSVRGWDDRTEYEAVTDDSGGAKGEYADAEDAVGGDENTRFRGTVGEGNVDTFTFVGRLTLASAGPGGHVEYSVEDGTGGDVTGAIEVEGSGFYYLVTRGDVDAVKSTEESENAVRENAAAGVLTKETHQLEATGELAHISLHPTDSSRLVVRHSFA